jgi:hypothetical protein
MISIHVSIKCDNLAEAEMLKELVGGGSIREMDGNVYLELTTDNAFKAEAFTKSVSAYATA